MLEEVEDRDGKVMVGWQQPGAPRDNSVPVMIGVAGPGDLEAILDLDQRLHRIG